MDNMKNINITKIIVHAKAGSLIGACLRDGIILAAKEWQNVVLVHNEKEYKISPNDLMETVKEGEF